MKYLALIYHSPSALEDYSQEQYERLIEEHHALQAYSKAEGSFVGADKLEPSHTAKTLIEKNNEVIVSDGPFAETKEVLVGYYLFDCRDFDHALALAKRIPRVPTTKIEVRPVNFHVE